MKTYIFPYYVNFGPGDNVDCEIEFELSDEEAERLEKSAREEPRFHLDEDESLEDIYDKLYDYIRAEEIACLIADPSILDLTDEQLADEAIVREYAEDHMDNLSIGINYPEELQDLESDEA